LCKYLDREQKEIGENNKKQNGSKIIEKYGKNENKPEYSKIFISGVPLRFSNSVPDRQWRKVNEPTGNL
jgi:hypothetical protein